MEKAIIYTDIQIEEDGFESALEISFTGSIENGNLSYNLTHDGNYYEDNVTGEHYHNTDKHGTYIQHNVYTDDSYTQILFTVRCYNW